MFEREIQRAKELLTQRMTAASQYVYWDDIRRRTDIAVFYRNFFGAEAQWWVFEQQMQRVANTRFDTSNPALTGLFSELDHMLMESARFDHHDLHTALELAVKTRFNYILRPRTTLKWFVYRGEPTKTLHEVMLRMDYFLEYDYMLDGVRGWISSKQQEKSNTETSASGGHFSGNTAQFSSDRTDTRSHDTLAKPDSVRPFRIDASLVSVVEFDRVLQNVDNEVILEYSPEEFTDLLTPIFEMFDEIHAGDRALQQYRGKVPTPALIIFLDDKGIYRIAQELEELMKTRSLRYVGQREFLHLLNDIVAKLELSIDNDELPDSAPRENNAALPLDFTPEFPSQEEPILKADDTIGELAIGAAIRTKRTASGAEAPSTNTDVADISTADSSPISEEPKQVFSHERFPKEAPQKTSHAADESLTTTAPRPPRETSNQAPNTTTSVIDAEFEITEPLAASSAKGTPPSATQFNHPSFAMQAADLAEMFKNFDFTAASAPSVTLKSPQKTEAPKTETLKTEAPKAEVPKAEVPKAEAPKVDKPAEEQKPNNRPVLQFPAASSSAAEKQSTALVPSESKKADPEPPRSSFFTRFGSIFGSSRHNGERE
ncbi:MAG: hypothetical protein EAZ92_06645 [Candidatus Kapaibacterium sp.]|nr:MAG: hypothetical protein EAZ92_06645 [Candidatus Kapabacteria bacterium]